MGVGGEYGNNIWTNKIYMGIIVYLSLDLALYMLLACMYVYYDVYVHLYMTRDAS